MAKEENIPNGELTPDVNDAAVQTPGTDTPAEPTPKKRRGRPPKAAAAAEKTASSDETVSADAATASDAAPKKRRGRPPKAAAADASASVNAAVPSASAKADVPAAEKTAPARRRTRAAGTTAVSAEAKEAVTAADSAPSSPDDQMITQPAAGSLDAAHETADAAQDTSPQPEAFPQSTSEDSGIQNSADGESADNSAQSDDASQDQTEQPHPASTPTGGILRHDFEEDEPVFDTQTGERLNIPKKKYPAMLLTVVVSAGAIAAFVFAVIPGKLPMEKNTAPAVIETEAKSDAAEEAVPPVVQADTEKADAKKAEEKQTEKQTEKKDAEKSTEKQTEKKAAEKSTEKQTEKAEKKAVEKAAEKSEKKEADAAEQKETEKTGKKESSKPEEKQTEKSEKKEEKKTAENQTEKADSKKSEAKAAGKDSGKKQDKEMSAAALAAAETETEAETEAETETDAADGKVFPEFVTEGVVLSAEVNQPMDISDIVEQAMPSAVSVTCTNVKQVQDIFSGGLMNEDMSFGSGIIVAEDDDLYYIATENEIVADAMDITVGFSVPADTSIKIKDEEIIVPASLIGTDEELELAVLTVRKKDVSKNVRSVIKCAALGDSDTVRVGDRAIAIGNALGCGQSVTMGIVSARGKQQRGPFGMKDYIQTDASINYGNFGGALLNEKGQVIGINVGKTSEIAGEGMGYAFPINDVKPAIEKIIEEQLKKQPETEADGTEEKKLTELAVANASEKETEAAEKETAAEKKESAEKETEVDKKGSAEKETETGKQETISGQKETEAAKNNETEQKAAKGGMMGVNVAEISEENQIIYRIPSRIFIMEVVIDSGAAKAGLLPGDVITAINDEKTETVAEMKKLLSELNPGDKVRVSYVRPNEDENYDKDKILTVTVTLQ